ncbi:MAG: holo-ACP synthase [Myxococcales bacterium]|nr:holo-ACP synthase [Myxococcales bacterium]
MILGLGIDLVDVPAFGVQLSDPASHFASATFTAGELAYAQGAPSGDPVRHLAARYAAKEAAVKAIDLACARAGFEGQPLMPLKAIEVVCDAHGRPQLELYGPAAALATRLGADRTWVSISHDGNSAVATVVVERLT